MVMAPELSLRGRFAPVAISERHCRFVPTAGQTHAPCRGRAVPSRRNACGKNRVALKWGRFQICHCEGALRPWQSREGTCSLYKLLLKRCAPIASVAALSERHRQLRFLWQGFHGLRYPDLSLRGPEGAVAISGRQLRFRRWLSHIPTGYCEIAPQGHFLALRAQGATAPSGPRNDNSGKCRGASAPFYR